MDLARWAGTEQTNTSQPASQSARGKEVWKVGRERCLDDDDDDEENEIVVIVMMMIFIVMLR